MRHRPRHTGELLVESDDPATSPARRRLEAARPVVLSLARIVVGFLFACHGAKSIFGVLGAKSAAAVGVWPSWWAALIQLVCGTLLVLGLGTRYAAFLASGSMAFAYFTVHAPRGVLPITNGGEDAALFCWVLLLFVAIEPGPWALDRWITSRRGSSPSIEAPPVMAPPVETPPVETPWAETPPVGPRSLPRRTPVGAPVGTTSASTLDTVRIRIDTTTADTTGVGSRAA